MSLETWKAEFYPIPAHEVPVEDAVQHSLRKWRGLTKENLEKHGLVRRKNVIIESGVWRFGVESDSCSLCKHYLSPFSNCHHCPLANVLGGRCDEDQGDLDEVDSPYHEFTRNGNPLPMIEALERAAALEPDIRSA